MATAKEPTRVSDWKVGQYGVDQHGIFWARVNLGAINLRPDKNEAGAFGVDWLIKHDVMATIDPSVRYVFSEYFSQ